MMWLFWFWCCSYRLASRKVLRLYILIPVDMRRHPFSINREGRSIVNATVALFEKLGAKLFPLYYL